MNAKMCLLTNGKCRNRKTTINLSSKQNELGRNCKLQHSMKQPIAH